MFVNRLKSRYSSKTINFVCATRIMIFHQSPAFKLGNAQTLLMNGSQKTMDVLRCRLGETGIFGGVRGKIWLGWSRQYSERSLLTKPYSKYCKEFKMPFKKVILQSLESGVTIL